MDRNQIALAVLKTIREKSGGMEVRVMGNLIIERRGEPPLPLAILAQPAGGYLVWYVDGLDFHIHALVNEKVTHVVKIPLDKQKDFEKKLKEIQKEMGE